MADNGNIGRDDKVKKFLNWVNADENLPSLEELGYEQEDPDDLPDHVDVYLYESEADKDEKTEALKTADPEELTEDYEGDDEFDYPDEVAYVEELPAEEESIAGDEDSFVINHEPVYMTKKLKLQMKRFRVFYLILSAVVALNIIVVLLVTVSYLPEFGSQISPAVNEVYTRYVDMGLEDTGALNLVAAVLFSYRSFDTLGEAFVLYTAVIGVMLLMRKSSKPPSSTNLDS